MASLQETSPYLGATGMPTQTIESVEVTPRKIAELSGILIIQKYWGGYRRGAEAASDICVWAQRPLPNGWCQSESRKSSLSRTSSRSHLELALVYAKGCDL